jgi:ribosomal protein S18 acetylase RimI-like enzyme
MKALHYMWPKADGLAEPVEDSFRRLLHDPLALVVVGSIDGQCLGFLVARISELLPPGEQIATIELVFVSLEAREVGVGEAMLDLALSHLRERGLQRFDARVLPGHRLAKNFFEAGGFAARSILMHHAD